MKVNEISNTKQYNQSFLGKVSILHKEDVMRRFEHMSSLQNFIKHADSLESLTIDIRELIKSMRLTQTDKFVVKSFLNQLGEENSSDFPVEIRTGAIYRQTPGISFLVPQVTYDNSKLEIINSEEYFDYIQSKFKRDVPDIFNGMCNKIRDVVGYRSIIKYPFIKVNGRVKQYECNNSLPKEKTFIKMIKSIMEYYIKSASNQIDCKIKSDEKARQKAATIHAAVDQYFGRESNPESNKIAEKKLLPISSLICTLDDIINYLDTHERENDNWGFIFNEPVTKDGETLLMALAHVKPTSENIDKYKDLVERMIKMKYINYNQSDSLNIPLIDHIINSENELLLAAASNTGQLIYTPELENTFNRIKNPEFKRLVLEANLFEGNIHNIRFRTIFGQPNPKL